MYIGDCATMCGRFANGLEQREFFEALETLLPDITTCSYAENAMDYLPTYNFAPEMRYPIVRTDQLNSNKDRSFLVETMRWGIKPGDTVGTHLDTTNSIPLMINTRDDTLIKNKSFWRRLGSAHRCVVFCQGFFMYGNGQSDKTKKIPYFVGMRLHGVGRIGPNGERFQLMPMAGMWIQSPEPTLRKFTVITTNANKQLGFLHDRVPVILPDADAIAQWLGVNTQPVNFADILRPFAGELDCYRVPKEVGSVGCSKKSLIQPVDARQDGIKAMFSSISGSKNDVKQHAEHASIVPSKTCSGAQAKTNSKEESISHVNASCQEDEKVSSNATSRSPAKLEPLFFLDNPNSPDKKRKFRESRNTLEGPGIPNMLDKNSKHTGFRSNGSTTKKRAKDSKQSQGTPRLEAFWNRKGD